MNKIKKYSFYLIFIQLSLNSEVIYGLSKSDALKIYHEANISYQKLDYEKSIKLYAQLIKEKHLSAEVFYNLGNSYFKAGNFAKAILNYERAKKLLPDDEDVNFNMKIASLKVVDKIESVPEVFYKKWINNLSILFPANILSIILITMIWLLFLSAAIYVTGRTVAIKKVSFILLVIFFCMTFVSGVLAARSHAIARLDIQAVIMSSSVYVKSSPDEKGNDLFILHEGTKVDVLDNLNNWKKIRIANGSIGWIKSDEIEII